MGSHRTRRRAYWLRYRPPPTRPPSPVRPRPPRRPLQLGHQLRCPCTGCSTTARCSRPRCARSPKPCAPMVTRRPPPSRVPPAGGLLGSRSRLRSVPRDAARRLRGRRDHSGPGRRLAECVAHRRRPPLLPVGAPVRPPHTLRTAVGLGRGLHRALRHRRPRAPGRRGGHRPQLLHRAPPVPVRRQQPGIRALPLPGRRELRRRAARAPRCGPRRQRLRPAHGARGHLGPRRVPGRRQQPDGGLVQPPDAVRSDPVRATRAAPARRAPRQARHDARVDPGPRGQHRQLPRRARLHACGPEGGPVRARERRDARAARRPSARTRRAGWAPRAACSSG